MFFSLCLSLSRSLALSVSCSRRSRCMSIWPSSLGCLLIFFLFHLFYSSFYMHAVCVYIFFGAYVVSLDNVLLLASMAIITFLFIHMSSTVHFICRMRMCLLCASEIERKIKYVFKFSSNKRTNAKKRGREKKSLKISREKVKKHTPKKKNRRRAKQMFIF